MKMLCLRQRRRASDTPDSLWIASIEIFTDSVDRCPEVDLNDDNPFYGEGATVLPEPVKRTSKRRKISVEGEMDQTIEQLEKRDDGMLYVL
jgi:hypothetical protein